MRYFEDFPVGATFDVGSTTVTEEEIIRFAEQFDPQTFHTDPVAAKESSFGGLVASGWHTCGIFMRMYVEQVINGSANLGGAGVDDMRWLVPVRPGDTVTGKATVVEARASESKPDRGIVGTRFELTNQRGELVWHATAVAINLRRPAADSG